MFLEHPDITTMNRYGTLSKGKDVCPVCGQECEEIYSDRFGYVEGCDRCMDEE